MRGVLSGFVVIGGLVLVGYLLGRFRVLGDNARDVLARLAFFVASPALLFQLLSSAELGRILSVPLLVTVLATLVCAGVFVLIGIIRHWGVARTTVGAMCASYVNAGNLGIPIAAYVLGDATIMAPVMLFQMLVYAPSAITVIDVATSHRTSFWQILASPLRNPVVVGSVIGLLLAITGWEAPKPITDVIGALAGLAVPAMLLAYGISLHGSAAPGRGEDRELVWVAVPLKMLLQPLTAWLLGAFAFDLHGHDLLTVVVIAALPSAQNLFTYAVRYRVGTVLARDAILISTTAAPFLLAGIAAALG